MAHRLQIADLARMTSFGTFKPTGYVVLAYRDEATARRAAERFAADGLSEDDVQIASSDSVFPQMDGHMAEASGVAGAQGYEVLLMKRYRDIAAQDAWWLFVWAPGEAEVDRVKRRIGDPRPLTAAHYGRLLIEDLSEASPGGTSAVDQSRAASRSEPVA